MKKGSVGLETVDRKSVLDIAEACLGSEESRTSRVELPTDSKNQRAFYQLCLL